MRLLLLLLPVAALSSAPSRASADDTEESGPEEIDDLDHGQPIPTGYTAVKRTRKGIALAGAITFAVSYGMSVVIPALEFSYDGNRDSAALVIPVVGPFLQLAQPETASGRPYLIVAGTAQTIGVMLLVYGLTMKKTVYVRNDLVGSMTVTPMTGEGTTGMILSGQF